jgi:hypothetical protein
MLPEPETCADRLELRSTNRLWPFGQPSSQRNLVTGPRGGYLPPLAAETSYQPLKVAEMLWVVSAIVMSENTTVIGGLHSGLNVAVAVSVNSACPFCTGKSLAAETLVLCWRRPDMAAGLDALGRRAQDNVNLILVPKAGFLARDRDRIARRCHGERPLDEVRRSRECDGRKRCHRTDDRGRASCSSYDDFPVGLPSLLASDFGAVNPIGREDHTEAATRLDRLCRLRSSGRIRHALN